MARGGSRKHATNCTCGRCPQIGRPRVKAERAESAPKKQLATEILESLGKSSAHPKKCKCEKCLWKRDAERENASGREARKYLWDRRDGKPVQRSDVNHMHDKPIEMHVDVSLSELVRKVRERKLKYERSSQ